MHVILEDRWLAKSQVILYSYWELSLQNRGTFIATKLKQEICSGSFT